MSTLSLDSLQQQGAFTGAPVAKTITWMVDDQEYTATVYVRRLSYQAAVQDVRAYNGQVDGIAGRIASCICDEHGASIFTPEDITGEADPERGPLGRSLTLALLGVIGEVNPSGKTPSRSATKRKSGTSSSSTASAGARSPRRKRD
ncbi:Phage tail assembly chaperone, TAC [Onishia taeanensis]|uniref:Phage tail assembly chaperone, TAC n=1 Tax=Onishia taeanensis TaxID=284577 RepID=A0A1G7N746_9GAMM|nr:phage tail assembly chaperone family protein, TAC [Halomonas taeanensis]SDF69863.1 Phage tail assembly chaperone, TAC [Halomonas taeanensis]